MRKYVVRITYNVNGETKTKDIIRTDNLNSALHQSKRAKKTANVCSVKIFRTS